MARYRCIHDILVLQMIVFFSSDSHGNLFCAALEKVVREQRVLYGKHMDITSYDEKRETHNPAGGFFSLLTF
jgi:hypothetical protein